jgi:hypothetical protein
VRIYRKPENKKLPIIYNKNSFLCNKSLPTKSWPTFQKVDLLFESRRIYINKMIVKYFEDTDTALIEYGLNICNLII